MENGKLILDNGRLKNGEWRIINSLSIFNSQFSIYLCAVPVLFSIACPSSIEKVNDIVPLERLPVPL